ncbi:thiosulfate sulfurtransferase/rhodanese-like domain-containing protein 3 isoform X1 [Chamaea fasciata]|uniref:thiosulfate sulfurtransferase/rhodanese-like domain-containing protein 3 isoform X1 n=1 Tax=Chamaea fasciata TaxID=190680 RepID=UPI00336AA5B8
MAGMGPGGWWRAARALRAAGGGWSQAAAPGPTCRGFCAAAEPNVSYQELKDLKKANVLHIDVRERWEIDRFGKIPESVNIPLGELMEALQMDPMEFKEQYNQKMPSKSDPVVFSCLAGTRSKQALGFAMSLGFSRMPLGVAAKSPSETTPQQLCTWAAGDTNCCKTRLATEGSFCLLGLPC